MSKGKEFLSQLKMYSDYMKWNETLQRYETWDEACIDVLNTHKSKYGKIANPFIQEILPYYQNREFLVSQRNLQFRGDQVLKHNPRIYNCCTTYCNTPDVFSKGFYILLCGTGLGVNMFPDFVSQLPQLTKRKKGTKTFVIEDSIEGWANAVRVLLSSYCRHSSLDRQYFGYIIKFDYSLIRPKGSFITGGFKSPGHAGLKQSLERIESLIDYNIDGHDSVEFRSIIAYDIFMHLSDAVLSGGVRRSAMNIIMSPDDTELLYAKTGDWRMKYPWRARSNNSVGLLRGEFDFEQLTDLLSLNEGDNDVGFVFMNSVSEIYNPCFTLDTKILTDNGWRTFGELLDTNPTIMQDLRLKGYESNGQERWEFTDEKGGSLKPIKAYNVSKTAENQTIYRLTTKNHRVIKTTGNHHIGTTDGMKTMDSIKVGDKLLIGVADEYNCDKTSFTYKRGLLAGLLYGDGTGLNQGTARLDIWVSDVKDEIEDIVEDVLSSTDVEVLTKRKAGQQAKTNPKFRKSMSHAEKYSLESVALYRDLRSLGFKSKDDLSWLHHQDKEFKAGFISGLVFTDGHVEGSKKSKTMSLRITQSNLSALQDIQLIMQELGVMSRIYSLFKNHTSILPDGKGGSSEFEVKDSYRLAVSDKSSLHRLSAWLYLFDSDSKRYDQIVNEVYWDSYYDVKKPTSYWDSVKSIEILDEKQDVYCLSENVNRTVVADGIVARRCYEIGFNFWDIIEDKKQAAFQFCNLCEINASTCKTKSGRLDKEKFFELCRVSSIAGTLQAGYTDFPFLNKQTENIVAGEALLGVSITGWFDNPDLFNEEVLIEGARIVKETNAEVASKLGINPAARTTCVKPSGNACTTFDTEIKTNLGVMTLGDIFNYCTGEDINHDNLLPETFAVPKNVLKVYDENNEEQEITALYVNGFAETYDIEFEDGLVYSFTGNHRLKTLDGWKYVRDITVDDEIVSFETFVKPSTL